MPEFAIDEIYNLIRELPTPIDDRHPIVRYLCALFAELAYYQIPQWEIDGKKKRAILAPLVPCEAYRTLARRNNPTDVNDVLRKLDAASSFIVQDRGVIAIGIVFQGLLFIGFRGTQFLFDWSINLSCKLVTVSGRLSGRPPFIFSTLAGKLHSGFCEEAIRISLRILDAIRDSNIRDIKHVFFAGHSLGGAVAAISEQLVRVAPKSVCVFGTPRYSDSSAYITLPEGPPTHIRRAGDIVPRVPPKIFGYADHPYEFATDGFPYVEPAPYSSSVGELMRWAMFLMQQFKPHDMEDYRKELGATAGAQGAPLPLTSV